MLLELYIFYEIIVIGLFATAFFTKQEILWTLTLMLSGVLAFSSYNIEYYVYKWNMTANDYNILTISNSYPYLMGINLAFFVLALLLGIFDIWDKYGGKLTGGDNINE